MILPASHGWCHLHLRERGSPMKNRKREICTSGSARPQVIGLLGGAAAMWPFAASARQFSAQCYTRGAHKSECYGA
jgi:hypothetical protein